MSETITDTGRTYLRWALTDGVGPLRFSKICDALGGAETALGASAATLRRVDGIGPKLADAVARAREEAPVDDEIAAAEENGVRIICRVDSDYPPGLRQIHDAPIVLYVKGELRDTDAIAIAIVGSRRCSIYGGEQARRFGELLAGAGFTIVSGLARGTDAFAHHGAIDARGRTIAVMGRGLNEVYPPENAGLADRVLACGAWVSELPMRAGALAGNFPNRNRIIAGLALGTIVVEAAKRSGALITATLASEYNREVFAVPGRAQDPMSFGTNALIRDSKAKLVMSLEDVLEELGPVGEQLCTLSDGEEADDAPQQADASVSAPPKSRPIGTLTLAEHRVFEMIPNEPVFQEMVLGNAELPPGDVLAAITSLELKGMIRRLPGQMVCRRVNA